MSDAARELFEPGIYLDARTPGYFSTLVKDDGRARQQSWELRLLADVLRVMKPDRDSWISQASFTRPNRRAVNVRDVGLCFCDLDTYRVPGLLAKHPEELLSVLLTFCETEGLPAPSLVVYSGRGLQPKWLTDEPTRAVDLISWNRLQEALVSALRPLGADPAARDVSRVLRLDRTVNTRSGELVRVLYQHGDPPATYSAEDLAAALSPWTSREAVPEEEDLPERRPSVVSAAGRFAARRLNWRRLHDMLKLAELRHGFREGQRELALFWSLTMLFGAEPGRACDFWREAEAIGARLSPDSGYWQHGDLSTLYRRAMAARAGVRVEYHGKSWSPIYSVRTSRLLETFSVSSAEQRYLSSLIGPEEKRRRRDIGPWVELGLSRRTWFRRKASGSL